MPFMEGTVYPVFGQTQLSYGWLYIYIYPTNSHYIRIVSPAYSHYLTICPGQSTCLMANRPIPKFPTLGSIYIYNIYTYSVIGISTGNAKLKTPQISHATAVFPQTAQRQDLL